MTNATVLASIAIVAAYVDSKGNVAAAPATPVWSVDQPTLATITPSVDGLSATLTPVGPLGTVVVTATAGAVVGTASITLTAGPATTVTLTTTVSEPAPAAPAP